MTKVLYPGSFDPIHNGHVESIETASHLFDEVVVATMRNPQKGEPLFTLVEREEMIEESLSHLDNIEVVSFAKLVVDVALEIGADFIIKGLRSTIDRISTLQCRSHVLVQPLQEVLSLGRGHQNIEFTDCPLE